MDTCPNDHPKTPENTYRNPTTGKAQCGPCARNSAKRGAQTGVRTDDELLTRRAEAEAQIRAYSRRDAAGGTS